MYQMPIPKSFTLNGSKYVVNMYPKLPRSLLGRVYLESKFVQIRTTEGQVQRRSKAVAETFWHEAIHAILYEMGSSLYRDEKFVTAFSKGLNQLVHSAKFDR